MSCDLQIQNRHGYLLSLSPSQSHQQQCAGIRRYIIGLAINAAQSLLVLISSAQSACRTVPYIQPEVAVKEASMNSSRSSHLDCSPDIQVKIGKLAIIRINGQEPDG